MSDFAEKENDKNLKKEAEEDDGDNEPVPVSIRELLILICHTSI
jgi:hypothetical protein